MSTTIIDDTEDTRILRIDVSPEVVESPKLYRLEFRIQRSRVRSMDAWTVGLMGAAGGALADGDLAELIQVALPPHRGFVTVCGPMKNARAAALEYARLVGEMLGAVEDRRAMEDRHASAQDNFMEWLTTTNERAER